MVAFRATARTHAGFGNIGNEKRPATAFDQRRGDLIDTAAIGICLDHARALGLGALAKPFPIGCYCRQADLQDAASDRIRRALDGDKCRKPLVINDKPPSPIDDLSFDRAFDQDARPFFDGQVASEISTNP